MGGFTLVLGGARSGKSRFAQNLARRREEEGAGKVAYLATALAGDPEMEKRIARHRRERPPHWTTIEEPIELADTLVRKGGAFGIVIIDCLTLWISNLLSHGDSEACPDRSAQSERVIREVDRLLAAIAGIRTEVILISNEVGLGVVPPSELGRFFRDVAGLAHQRIASEAERVYFMVAGLARQLK